MKTDFNKLTISSYFFRRRIKLLTRLFYGLIITCFLLTAYLYGLIEIDSHKVVFKIMPSGLGSHKTHFINYKNSKDSSNNNNNMQSSTNEDYFVNIKQHNNNNNNKKLSSSSSDSDLKNLKYNNNSNKNKRAKLINLEKLNIEKNITKLFATIERYSVQIKTQLRSYEASNIADLKEKYEKLGQERKARLKKELNKLKAKKTATTTIKNNQTIPVVDNENADDDDDDDDEEDEDLSLASEFSNQETVTRELMVRFLRYENYKLKKKQNSEIKTIKNILAQFDLNKELDTNELPQIWEKYFLKINEYQLYNDTSVLNDILKAMSSSPVVTCHEKERGTQIKLILLLADGTDVLVKPMKVPRNYETPPDHFYFTDFERHHAEIAAFHLDRVLGFFRVPPTVGRLFNISADLWQKADTELAKTFFFSPAGNTCFSGHCSYYCDTTHAICGKPGDKLEGSVQLLLPSKPLVDWKATTHPYRRSYNRKRKADWEINQNYCTENVFTDDLFQSKLLLDLMDMAVFDFLTGNMDRHHFERMISLSNKTFSLHLDNGRAFGKQYHDEVSIIAPLKQCCLFRYSTFIRLKNLYKIGLAKVLDESLKLDPLYPILTEDHLKAVDRRLETVLLEISKCTENFLPTQVIVDDGY